MLRKTPESQHHGYWAQDFEVNRHLGTFETRELVRKAHDRNIKVILDISNHVGQLFYYDINQNGQPDEHVMIYKIPNDQGYRVIRL